jgi:hypothetical protein
MKKEELTALTEKELFVLTDKELLDEAKKMKSFSLTNALLIGFLAGIVTYSVAQNTWGFLTLIPLYFIHKFVNDPKNIRVKVLDKLLKERNLK